MPTGAGLQFQEGLQPGLVEAALAKYEKEDPTDLYLICQKCSKAVKDCTECGAHLAFVEKSEMNL
jgi:hypothetical protein